MRWTLRAVVVSGAASLAVLMFGFILFANWSTRSLPVHIKSADGIVVLTGADRRIEEGLRLLREGLGRRMLISGVNPRTSPDDVLRIAAAGQHVRPCCVDFGYLAHDTVGNAEETRDWATRHNFTRLIVVTSSYHMPRSLSEIARLLPDAELVAYPVVPRFLDSGGWWLRMSATRVLVAEYLKLITSVTLHAAARLMRPFEAVAAHALTSPPVPPRGSIAPGAPAL